MANYEGQLSRVEAILRATLGQDVEVPEPLSRVEELLIELKEAIEAGGGGGGDITQILARLSQCERDIDALELADTGLANAIQELVTAVNGKANSSDVYTKTEVDTALNNKAEKSTTYTKTEVDTALSGKQSTLTTTQLAAVNSGINGDKVSQIATNTAGISTLQSQADWNTIHGVKNMATKNTFTATLRKTLTIAGELSGKVTLSMSNITSTDTDDTRCRILFEYKDGGSGGDVFCQRNTSYKQNFDIGTHILDKITIYASDNYAHSSGDIVTVTELMVKPTTIGDDTYQPYAMSNAELTKNEVIDRAALVELVDKGAKNFIDAASGSGTRWTDITCNLPAGEWVLSFDELSTTWEAPTNNSIQIGFFTENYSSVTSNYVYIDLDAKVLKVTTLDTAKIIRVYASPTSVTGKTITYRNAMVCTEAAWNISQAYQPYRPSYDELVARIEALENA